MERSAKRNGPGRPSGEGRGCPQEATRNDRRM